MEVQAQVLVIDFGSQYTQLIARRLRELGVLSEICSCDAIPVLGPQVRGIVLSGGPHSVCDADSPRLDVKTLPALPVLGICYGAQLIAQQLGGKVQHATHSREYGKATLHICAPESYLLAGIDAPTQVWMSHGDTIDTLPKGLYATGRSEQIACSAFESADGHWAGLQFHPEVVQTTAGKDMLLNFMTHCGCSRDWTPAAFIDTEVAALQARVAAEERVIMALSGGVDSSVAALLLHKALGARLHNIFIDTGLLRAGEYEEVLALYEKIGLQVQGVQASTRFYAALQGITDPETKRKAIGRTFIEVFAEAAKTIPNVKWLAQGTIYPDRIESQATAGPSQVIKSHHNVGGLPAQLPFELLEPLGMLFKDEVRKVGRALGLSDALLQRHPFPGPGLAIRIIGEVNKDNIAILQAADAIFIEALHKAGLYLKVWQAGAILLPVRSVGVQGDQRSYAQVLVLRAVVSQDGMTAQAAQLPYAFLSEVATDIINRVPGINRVTYDYSSKPPATIEWE